MRSSRLSATREPARAASAGPQRAAATRASRRGGGWHLAALAVGAALLLALLAAAGVFLYLRASLPDDPARLAIAGLSAPVEVRYDARRRPYVRAESRDDALLALGWLHARERLWQMEMLRRAGRARLAEVLGEDLLDTDVELTRVGLPEVAAQLEANARPATRAAVERYVAGVNAAVARRDALPPEFVLVGFAPEPWRPRDVFAVGAMVAFDSANNYEQELLRLALRGALDRERFRLFLPDESAFPDFPYVVPPEDALTLLARADAARAPARPQVPSASLGSSSWAVGPERSRGDAALFAFDSHDAWSLPPLLYEAHLFWEGEAGAHRAVRGWTLPGLPGAINGANDRIAWGMTNVGDSQDLFLETRVGDDDPLRFAGREGPYRAKAREVAIPVAGRDAPHRVRVVETENGRLLGDDPPVALRWTGHDLEGDGLGALLAMNEARSFEAFSRALDGLAAPSSNVTYADVDGRIATRVVGRLPVRGRGAGLVPLPGDAPDTSWRGTVPVRELPRAVDPPRRWVGAANARTAPPGSGPLVSAENAPGYRMRRIREALAGARELDADAMRALQLDWRNLQAALLLPALLPEVRAGELEPAARHALEVLRAWSEAPENRPDAPGPLLFAQWYVALADAVFAEALGAELHGRLLAQSYVLNHALDRLILDEPDSPWWRADRAGIATRSFAEAVRRLEDRLGGAPADWRWDRLHRLRFPHDLADAAPGLDALLSRGPYAWGGGNPTLGRARYRYDRPFEATGGASLRFVAELTEPMQLFAVTAGGQSGHFLSRHYDDQLAPWLAGELDALAAAPEDLGEVITRLVPERGPAER